MTGIRVNLKITISSSRREGNAKKKRGEILSRQQTVAEREAGSFPSRYESSKTKTKKKSLALQGQNIFKREVKSTLERGL